VATADDTEVLRRLDVPRISILGGTRLSTDGRDVAVVGKPGRLLTALVLHRLGLTGDQLLDVLWPDALPKSARAALHVHLGTLRKVLAAAPEGATIERAGSRYRLRLDHWDVDVDLIRALVDEAERAATLDPDVAVKLFDEALAIWPSTAFEPDDTLTGSFEMQFNLARLDAEESRIDALITLEQLGRAESIALGMVEAEPYRERRWSQLMRIRVAQGRAASALETYRDARRRIVEDLGVEPGAELQALERAVLTRGLSTADPTFEPTDELDAIPTVLGPLIGRSSLIGQIESALAAGRPVVLLGAPGAGKTRAALEIVTRRGEWSSDVAWLDLRNAQFDQHAFDDRLLRWARRHPGGLAVVDNAESVAGAVHEAVDAVRRAAPTVGILVTSRAPVMSDAAVLFVDPLGLPATNHPEEIEASPAVRLLRSMLESLTPSARVDSELAARLVRRTGGLPLAIRLTAELARTAPLAEVVDQPGLGVASDVETAVTAVLDQVDTTTRDAFCAISVVAGPLDRRLVEALVGGDHDAGPLLRTLTERGLVHYDPSDGLAPYSVLEPLREAAHTMLTPDERAAALDRLADDCRERSAATARSASARRDGVPLESVLTRELAWHRRAIGYLAEIGDDRRALRLVADLELPLYSLGWWDVNTELQDAALAISGEPSALRARVHAARGRPGLLHQLDEAHLDWAIKMAERFDDLRVAGRASYQLAIRRWWQGRCDDALELFDRSRRMGERAGDRFVVVEARRFAGVALVSSGELERGFQEQLDVLRLAERTAGMELLAPHVRMYLGHCRRHVGDDAAAIVDLNRSRDEYESVGNRASLIHIYAGLAELHADHGHSDEAERHAARGLELAAGRGLTTYDPWLFATIARVHAASGSDALARAAVEEAVIALSRSWAGELHRVAVELSAVCHALGDLEAAARLVGVADGAEDRRELPFRTPAERARYDAARTAARRALGERYDRLHRLGLTSTLSEALARVTIDAR
jgi:DNA-binding SARP family transcriptional activator/tetratricopeptide (TPR) repeat protein